MEAESEGTLISAILAH